MRDETERTAIDKREHRLPPADDRDAPLGLQEAVCDGGNVRPTPVVLLHGATFGSAMFDIGVPGYSLQTFLAVRGWRNFALDVRGYGRSVPCAILDAPPGDNEPYARLEAAVEDLAAGLRFALDKTGARAANIVSFSWGTVVACVFAARHPELVENLVLYAPLYGETNDLWIERIADPADRTRVNPRLGAYRWIGAPDIRARWDADIPEGAKVDAYREERVLRAIAKGLADADPGARDRPDGSFRAPTGALVDLFEIFNGRPLYDPRRILAPTMIIRGQDDTTSTQSDALGLFAALGTPHKRYVAISPGSHFLCAERNAIDLLSEIDLFLAHRPLDWDAT
jgi:pimeloyl-ACP methyl ester carboxylesterase